MINCGLLTMWGWARGMSYISSNFVDALKTKKYGTHILKFGRNPISSEFPDVDTITEIDGIEPNTETFIKWIKDNKLTHVIFNEYLQWPQFVKNPDNLIEIAKQQGCKTIGYLIWEKFNPRDIDIYESYDVIVCQTKAFYKKCRTLGLTNIKQITWGLDLTKYKATPTNNKRVLYFHPGGWGGVHNRKNTDLVLKAFSELKDDTIELVVTTQKTPSGKNIQYDFKEDIYTEPHKNIHIFEGTLSRKDLLNVYKKCDVVILPSKWEGLGIPFIESLAFGKPVITVDSPPMNEIIKNNVNGCLAGIESVKHYEDIFVPAVLASKDDLKTCINVTKNYLILDTLSKNARKIAEDTYDWNKNMKDFLKVFENEK